MSKKPRPNSLDIGAAEFKARCLELMDRVKETGRSFFGCTKGSVLAYDRPFDPIDGDYDIMNGRKPRTGASEAADRERVVGPGNHSPR